MKLVDYFYWCLYYCLATIIPTIEFRIEIQDVINRTHTIKQAQALMLTNLKYPQNNRTSNQNKRAIKMVAKSNFRCLFHTAGTV